METIYYVAILRYINFNKYDPPEYNQLRIKYIYNIYMYRGKHQLIELRRNFKKSNKLRKVKRTS